MGRFDLVDGEKMYLENGKYCEWEDVQKALMVIREKARILTEISPFRIDEPTRQIAQDIVHCIDGIKENRE